MPVTARLSRNFYETLGDSIANELVDWMNAVDLSYRQDLLQINDANVSRFNATIDARFADARAQIEARFADLRAEMDLRFTELRAEMNGRFSAVHAEMDRRFAETNAAIAQLDKRLTAIEARIETALGPELDARFARVETALGPELDARFAKFESRLLKWMLVFWSTTLLATAAAVLTILQARG